MSAQHRPWRGSLPRLMRLRFVIVVALLALIPATLAQAYWHSTGSGSTAATTGTLNAPTGVTASSTAGSGAVSVSWVASSGSPTPSGYYVTRTDSGSVTTAACGTSPSSTTGSTSCSDTSVPLGTYTYRVIAVYHSWTRSSAPSASVTVAQASQSITFTSSAPAGAAVGGTYTVSATGGASGNAVTFSTLTTSVCTVSGSTVTFVHPGTCTIDANQSGSTYYTAAPTAHQQFTVAKAAQVITFTSTAPTGAVVGGADYTVAATGGASGNAVVFSIDAVSGTVCTISGSTVHFAHVGTCVIDANQVGNSDYLAANQAQQSVAVGKGAQAITITSTPPSPANVGGTYAVTATSTSGLTVAITLDATSSGCSLAGNTVTFTGAGTCKVDANQAGNADYLAAAQMQQSFPVTKVNQTISFTSTAPSAAVVGGATYTATATATSGLTVLFTSATPTICTSGGTNGATFTFIAAGTCTVDADQAGNATYNAAPQVAQSFTVGKGTQTITFTSTPPSPANVGGTYTVTATSTSGLTVAITLDATSTGCSLAGSTVTFTAAGTCKIDANQAGNGNYLAATQVQQSFAVTKVNQTISFTSTAPSGAVVGGATYTASATATSGLTVLFTSATPSVCSSSGTNGATFTFLTAGTCTVNANQAGNTTYNAAPQVQQSFTVAANAATGIIITNASNSAGAITPVCTGSGSTWTCTALGSTTGNNRFFTAKISLVNAAGTVVTNTTGATITVSLSGSPSESPASLTIVNGASTSAGTFTVTLANGSGTGTYSASATVNGHAATVSGTVS